MPRAKRASEAHVSETPTQLKVETVRSACEGRLEASARTDPAEAQRRFREWSKDAWRGVPSMHTLFATAAEALGWDTDLDGNVIVDCAKLGRLIVDCKKLDSLISRDESWNAGQGAAELRWRIAAQALALGLWTDTSDLFDRSAPAAVWRKTLAATIDEAGRIHEELKQCETDSLHKDEALRRVARDAAVLALAGRSVANGQGMPRWRQKLLGCSDSEKKMLIKMKPTLNYGTLSRLLGGDPEEVKIVLEGLVRAKLANKRSPRRGRKTARLPYSLNKDGCDARDYLALQLGIALQE